jgi:hypothetical protein
MMQLISILDSLYGNNKMKKWLHTNSQHASCYLRAKVRQNLIVNNEFIQMQDNIFFLKFGTWICEVVLNSRIKHQTGSLWTRPCGAKPRPAMQNHVRSRLQ